ncbi:MAG TPA: porin [Ramlibacter sp.]|nr:porin [Ramlibacter sp.]
MKNSLIALAAIAAAPLASAQSTVTLYGIVDATFQNLRADGNGSVSRLHNSGYNSSRLGFRGVEDLGGGLSAGFWLEAGVNNDSGAGAATNTNNQSTGNAPALNGGQGLTFNRRSTVSLFGPFGEVRIGRDNTASFWNLNVFDPFLNVGAGNALNMSIGAGKGTSFNTNLFGSARLSNTVAYLTPAGLGGFYGHGMVAFGENASNAAGGASKDGNYLGLRVGYAKGPVNVAVGHGHTKFSAGSTLGGDYVHSNAGASYDFNGFKLMGQWFTDEIQSAAATKQSGWLLGGTMKVGASGEARASLIRTKVANSPNGGQLWAIGYVHHLSKRTALYGTYAQVDNRGTGTLFHNGRATTVPGGNTSALDIGVRHSF